MPSPTAMIEPSSVTSTPDLNPWICCFRTLAISSALISMKSPWLSRLGQPLAQDSELALQGSVVHPRADPGARPAQDRGVDAHREPHGAARHLLHRRAELLLLRGGDRRGQGRL